MSKRNLFALSLFALASAAAAWADWPIWGGDLSRNMVSGEKGIPHTWDLQSGKNVKWKADIGSQSYGNPAVSDGVVCVGTNNNLLRNPEEDGDRGVLMCFEEETGKFLWQKTHEKLASGRVNDWPEQGVSSSPAIHDGVIYYVSNRAEIVAAELKTGKEVWSYDMIEELGVFPHNLATSGPLIVGDKLFVNTSNGVDETHINIPSPLAPSFIALHAKTGELIWENDAPGDAILHGQWSSPAYGTINGTDQVIFAGGDGWLYGLNPETGETIWRFDCNPKGSEWKQGRGDRNNLIATPVIYDNKVFIAVGQDPEHGEGVGHLWAVDAAKKGDITETGKVWHYPFRRSISTVAIHDGILYAANFSGFLHAIDLKTAEQIWEHDLLAAVWGSPYVVDGKVMIGDEDGDLTVLKAGRTKEVLSEINFGNAIYSTPVATNGTLYIMTRSALYAIAAE
jgi:outer membrane protein assembly factor BamB